MCGRWTAGHQSVTGVLSLFRGVGGFHRSTNQVLAMVPTSSFETVGIKVSKLSHVSCLPGWGGGFNSRKDEVDAELLVALENTRHIGDSSDGLIFDESLRNARLCRGVAVK